MENSCTFAVKLMVKYVGRSYEVRGNSMDIQWVSGQYAEDNRIFDSLHEVYEWTDSLYPEFLIHLVNKVNTGYSTPDEKVIESLAILIPKWADYLKVGITIHKDTVKVEGKPVYRIWTCNDGA